MAILPIITVPNPILKEKSRVVEKFDERIEKIVQDMIETLHQAPGVGLAAPQVGILERIIIVEWFSDTYDDEEDSDEDDDFDEEWFENNPPPKELFCVINPEIIKPSNIKIDGIEGCLSIPGVEGDVDRHVSLTVHGFDPKGNEITIEAKGWLARIFQHEIDHLDGILYTDRAKSIRKIDGPVNDTV